MVQQSGTEAFFKEYKRDSCEVAKDNLRRVCNDVLLDGINKAKKPMKSKSIFWHRPLWLNYFSMKSGPLTKISWTSLNRW